MKAYHGTNKEFESFDPSFRGEGNAGERLARGVYFASTVTVANEYRKEVSTPDSSFTDHAYFDPDGQRVAVTQEMFDLASLVSDDARAPESVRNRAGEMSQYLETLTKQEGMVYLVSIPEKSALLNWNGSSEDQEMDFIEIVKDLYGRDEIEEIYDEAAEEVPFSVSDDDFEKAFDDALLGGLHEYAIMEKLGEVAPDYDWTRLQKCIGSKAPGILGEEHGYADEDAGKMLYEAIRHAKGSDEAAAEFLLEHGVSGIYSSEEYTGIDVPNENYVIWDYEGITIEKSLSPREISQGLSAEKDSPEYELDDDYGMDL